MFCKRVKWVIERGYNNNSDLSFVKMKRTLINTVNKRSVSSLVSLSKRNKVDPNVI